MTQVLKDSEMYGLLVLKISNETDKTLAPEYLDVKSH